MVAEPAVLGIGTCVNISDVVRVYQSKVTSNLLFMNTPSKPMFVDVFVSQRPDVLPNCAISKPDAIEFPEPPISYALLSGFGVNKVYALYTFGINWLPVLPQPPRTFKSFTKVKSFIKANSVKRAPTENAGKTP